jgi:putative transposase
VSAQGTFSLALEAAKEQKTLSQLASEYEVHPTQITQWKKQLLDGGSSLFGRQQVREQQAQTAREAELFEQIGRLQMELAWVKKTVGAIVTYQAGGLPSEPPDPPGRHHAGGARDTA